MKRDSRAPLIVAIVLLLLPVLYVGSYFALVVPNPDDYRWFAVSLGYVAEEQNYRIASSTLSKVFWPLEQIDRKLRPRAWGAKGKLGNFLREASERARRTLR